MCRKQSIILKKYFVFLGFEPTPNYITFFHLPLTGIEPDTMRQSGVGVTKSNVGSNPAEDIFRGMMMRLDLGQIGQSSNEIRPLNTLVYLSIGNGLL